MLEMTAVLLMIVFICGICAALLVFDMWRRKDILKTLEETLAKLKDLHNNSVTQMSQVQDQLARHEMKLRDPKVKIM